MEPPFPPEIHLHIPVITPENSSQIHLIQQRLMSHDSYPEIQAWASEDQIMRFLIARNFDLEKAYTLLIDAIKWRMKRNPIATRVLDDDQLHSKMSREGETGKIYIPGFDKYSRPVIIFDNTVQNTSNSEDQLNFLAWKLDFAIHLMPPNVDKYVVFMHLNSFSLFNCPSMSVTQETIHMLCNCFPERLGHCVVYQPPTYFRIVFDAVSGLIDKKTVSKLIFINGDVSTGSANDLKMRELIGDDWKTLTGADQPVLKRGSSPGYLHETYWPTVRLRLQEKRDQILHNNVNQQVEEETAVLSREGNKEVESSP